MFGGIRRKIKTGLEDLLPDAIFLKRHFREKLGRSLNLDNPRSFNEKMQWLKLHDRKPEYTMLADKIAVKEHIARVLGDQYVIPTLKIWDSAEEIDPDALPEQFVLKCSHDSGSVVICHDKRNFDLQAAKAKMAKALKRDYYKHGREWPYKNIPRKVFAEKFLPQDRGLMDYKFFCFGGEPKFIYVSQGMNDHRSARMSFVNMDWTPAPFARSDYRPFEQLPPRPTRFEEMALLAKRLSAGFPFVRIDFYQYGEQVLFGEYTFTPCNGCLPFSPPEWDFKLGEWVSLPPKNA